MIDDPVLPSGYTIEDVEKVFSDVWGIVLNANDTFEYATSEGVLLVPSDFWWALDIMKRYPRGGDVAVMSYISFENGRGKRIPIFRTTLEERFPDFGAAYAELEKLQPEVYSD